MPEHFYEPRLGHGLAHDPFNAIVGPRPIGWIATRSKSGQLDLAPYSFFNALCYTPPLIGFASTGWKDTVRNIAETGEFVWNLVTRELAEAMNMSSAPVPHGVDEFALAQLATEPSRLVNVPRVAASPVAFECRLSQQLRLQGADGTPAEAWFTVGEVVGIHIAEHLLVNGVYDTAAGQPVLRGGGAGDYFELGPKFRMKRPG